jgi:hypothetical protein
MSEEYNGWKNYETWNVSLWINNEQAIYENAVAFMREANPLKNAYKGFVINCGLSGQRTPDKVAYMSAKLDYKRLDEMMKELIE